MKDTDKEIMTAQLQSLIWQIEESLEANANLTIKSLRFAFSAAQALEKEVQKNASSPTQDPSEDN